MRSSLDSSAFLERELALLLQLFPPASRALLERLAVPRSLLGRSCRSGATGLIDLLKKLLADEERRALDICPALAHPPHETGPVDVARLVTGEVVGFRPTRAGGIRLEAETVRIEREGEGEQGQGPVEELTVVHNYGHGGYGWQCAWGCAGEAARIVGEEVRRKGVKSGRPSCSRPSCSALSLYDMQQHSGSI